MPRSTIYLFVLLAAVVGPMWWFHHAPETRPVAQVPPPFYQPHRQPAEKTGAVFSSIGYTRNISPAQLPQSPVPSNFAVSSTTSSLPSATSNVAPGLPTVDPQFGQSLPPGTQTLVFPGNANGPFLGNGPLGFHPVHDFRQVFRFDLTPEQVKQRWDRVTSTSIGKSYRGLRVALVTGVNPWDLHGSLTYYFDRAQKLQRISFKGWTGDGTHFLNIMKSSYPLESLPTQWAGAYEAKREGIFQSSSFAGILLREPAVIRKQVPNEQLAIVLELNNPDGKLSLSNEYLNLRNQAVR